jgi:hypothetical protein
VASPELAAALRLLDAARRQGFSFHRIAPGEDGPLLGTRQTLDFRDVVYLGGFSGDCSATRYRRTFLLVPTGTSAVVETVTGDALTVLHTVCSDWQTEA